ncbi:MAG: DegT/DnrJ/EryC1/StrS family aminotransferase, partial [Candidatus Omnitrophica bacterium]|nr:DegT/DnrJ/EryC1/StrS family aminotransferase [Candidatus Omnitrophota bacterium]
MNIPSLDLKREYKALKKDIDKQLKDCLDSQQWILGPKVSEFEEKAAKYLGIKYAIGVASGTDALILSLKALALKTKKRELFDKKEEIITTPFTFIATAEAIVRAGATPVFVDIDSDTFNIDPSCIEKAITKNTVGILPVHLYGFPCDVIKISKIAKKHNLFTVEDCAQSFGASIGEKKTGTFSDCGAFSFFPSKNLGGFGDGGLIVTNNKTIAELVKVLRKHGQTRQYKADYIGYNSRLDSIQAAVLLAKLKHIDKFNNARIKIAKKYTQALKNIPQIQPPQLSQEPRAKSQEPTHVYHQYTIKVSSGRGTLLKYLNSKGIGARVYYPILLSGMKAFENCKCKGILKNAKEVSEKILSLPIHPFLKE